MSGDNVTETPCRAVTLFILLTVSRKPTVSPRQEDKTTAQFVASQTELPSRGSVTVVDVPLNVTTLLVSGSTLDSSSVTNTSKTPPNEGGEPPAVGGNGLKPEGVSRSTGLGSAARKQDSTGADSSPPRLTTMTAMHTSDTPWRGVMSSRCAVKSPGCGCPVGSSGVGTTYLGECRIGARRECLGACVSMPTKAKHGQKRLIKSR